MRGPSSKTVQHVMHLVMAGWWLMSLPSLGWANTFYVAPTGTDEASCGEAMNLATPKHTITAALTCLSQPGETISIREGVYAEPLILTAEDPPAPFGLSWETPLTIQAYEDEHVVLRPATGEAVIHIANPQVQFFLVNGLDLDATGVTTGVRIDGPHQVQMTNLNIFGAAHAGIHLTGNRKVSTATTHVRLDDLDIHHNGAVGLIVDNTSVVIQGSQIHDNGQTGLVLTGDVQDSTLSPIRIWQNRIWQNGTGEQSWGIHVHTTIPSLLYGNLLWQHVTGIVLQGRGATAHRILNNTILGPGMTGLAVQNLSASPVIHNNISVGHQANLALDGSEATQISHNLFEGAGVMDWFTGNGRLREDSPAIDSGLAIEPLLPTTARQALTDLDGYSRPMGDGWDIGAYEQVPPVGKAPTAAFTASPLAGIPPLRVDFLDQSTGTIDHWQWDFGDGSHSQDRHPTHDYVRAGSYPVTLTVTGPGGTDTMTHTAFVAIRTVPLQAAFSVVPTQGEAPLNVQGKNASLGEAIRFGWEWGDGTNSTHRHPQHTFKKPGGYFPQLTVYGPHGETAISRLPHPIVVYPPLGSTLLKEDFSDQDLENWEVVDEGQWQGPSQWGVAQGMLVQRSNIWSPPADPAHVAKSGTMLWYGLGQGWADYQVQVMMRSNDDDTVGLVFRYRDPDNYYRLSWDCERGLRRLIKKTTGQVTVLAEDHVPYIRGQAYQVQMKVFGAVIQVNVDGQPILGGPVIDGDQTMGSVGFYTWLNNASQFDDLEITEFQMPARHDLTTGGSR